LSNGQKTGSDAGQSRPKKLQGDDEQVETGKLYEEIGRLKMKWTGSKKI
jgi:hypothetical protein